MKRNIIFTTILVVLLAAVAIRGQNGPDNDADVAPGLTNSVFESGQVDSVNLYNGQLTVPIPLGPSYPIGPKLRMQLVLSYNSRVDDYGHPTTQSPDYFYKPLVGNPALPIGWELTAGAIKTCKHGNTTDNCYFSPDGSQHMLNKTRGNGKVPGDGSQFFLKGSGPYDMWDGDGNHYVFGWSVTGYDDSLTNYTHDFGIGRNGWYLSSVTDPFGNHYDVSYYSSISTPVWTPTSNGCGAAWPMQNPTQTQTWILKDITLPSGSTVHINQGPVNGVNGMITSVNFPEFVDGASATKTWTLAYNATPLSYTRFCASPNSITVPLQTLQQVQLPSDLAGSPKYQFLYASNGLLDQLTLPTAGTIAYCWTAYAFFHGRAGKNEPGCGNLAPADSAVIEVTPNSLCVGLDPTPPPQEPEIPGGCSGTNETQWTDSVLGVVRRTETVGGASFVTDYTQYAFPRGEAGSLLSKLEPQTLTVVLYPATDKTGTGDQRRAKAVLFKCSPQIVAAPPGTTRPSVPGDRVGAALEERHFETDPNQTSGLSDATAPMCTGNVGTDKPFCGSKAMRVVQMDYDYDDTTHQEGNRRLDHSKTIYGASTCGACPYHQVDFSPTGTIDWENNGRHYTTETHAGTLGSDARTITTVWAPVNWTSGPPTNGVVLPNILNQRTTTQGSVRDEYFQFDTTSTPPTDFLKGTFVYDSVKDIAFINCRYDDGDGTVDKELTKTLATATVPSPTYCTDNYSTFPAVGTDGDMFGKDYTWQHGELLNARWINGTVGTSTFKFQDFVRDATTGWVTSSADTSGRTTAYTYDSLGRVNQVTPPAAAEFKTWTCFESPTATTVYRASAKQTCPVPASNANAVTWQHVDYDGLGRLIRAQRKVSGVGTTNLTKRYNLFDGRGNPIFSSEWVACTSSPCQTNDEAVTTDIDTTCVFSGANQTGRKRSSTAPGTWRACWDPFGRPQQIVGAKHSSLVTVDRTDGTGNIYSDTKEAATTWCVNATFSSFTTGACNAGAITPNPVTTTQKDAFGRITQATPPDTSIEKLAKYAYDVNGKVTCVKQGGTADMSNCTSNPSGQYRKFDYDMNGFLRSEITPERGSVTYDTIGSLGNVRAETQPGSLSISRTFDFAGRLSEEDIPLGTKYVVNCYDGAATCVDGSSGFAGGSYPAGKLTRRYGYNWIPLIGPIVDEKFTYSDAGGRLSQLDTSVGNVGNGDLAATTTQSWTYDATNCHLGLVCTHNNPRVSGSFPVNYTYSFGLPTSISANSVNVVTAATFNPAAGLASWISGSSPTVTTTITQDTTLLPRPRQITAIKSGGTTHFDTGIYSYDSAGNVLSQSNATYGGSYTYDAGSRLLSANQGSTRSFTYDPYGNLTQNDTYSFTMDSGLTNHISTVTIPGPITTPVGYDLRGNVTSALGEFLYFDSVDRLYRSKNAAGDFTFLHNGAGERVLKFPSNFTVLRREAVRYIAEANIIARGWTLPAACPSAFPGDVNCTTDPDAAYINLASQQGITAGCGGTNFCPNNPVTRAQMAVFVVRGYKGAGFVPQSCPPAVNPFTDFTCSGPYAAFAPYIIQLYNDGVTGGCSTNPLQFCPGDTIGEWESLVWLARGGTPNNPFWPTYHPVPRGSTYTLRDEGNRVATEIAGGVTGSSTATLSVARDNVFLGSLLVASNAASAWIYSASDHLGSIRAIWDATGTKVEDHRYWPYGEDAFAALNQHLAFQSMERNDATAQYFDHARTQQFNLGRFVSTDSFVGTPSQTASWNAYSFALNNPLRNTDPTGLDADNPSGHRGLFDRFFSYVAGLFPKWFPAQQTAPGDQNLEAMNDESVGNTPAQADRMANPGASAQTGLTTGTGTVAAAVATAAVVIVVDRASGKVIEVVAETAADAAAAVRLAKSLASEGQMAERGTAIAGAGSRVALRDAERLAESYGGAAGDWAKIRSSSYTARDGVRFETHSYVNVKTGQQVEFKTKF